MMSGITVTQYFNEWCQERNITSQFEVRVVGRLQDPRYLCELRVSNFSHVGIGNSGTKWGAKISAVEDFLQFLNGEGKINRDIESNSNSQIGEMMHKGENIDMGTEVDELWTDERIELELNEFLRVTKSTVDYKFFVQREIQKSTWSFVCEAELFIEQLNRSISAKELGSSKKLVQTNATLHLARQLVNLGLLNNEKKRQECDMEKFITNKLASLRPREFEKDDEHGTSAKETPVYKVAIDPCIIQEAYDVLKELGIEPLKLEGKPCTRKEVSLLGTMPIDLTEEKGIDHCAPDEKPSGKAFLDHISLNLEKDMKTRLKFDASLQESIQERNSLPISSKKTEIMNAITQNPVTIIYGNPASRTRTQVCQFILDDYILVGRGAYCNIVVTQPYRLLAISAADRVAFERREELSTSVGYSVPFENIFPRLYGSIVFCTVDIFLRKLEHGLKDVSHIIVDGLHEQDGSTDLLITVLLNIVSKYSDLRIILLSSTTHMSVFNESFSLYPSIIIPVKNKITTYTSDFIIELAKKNRLNTSKKIKLVQQYKAHLGVTPEPLIQDILLFIKSMGIRGTILICEAGSREVLVREQFLKKHSIFGKSNFSIIPLHNFSTLDELREATSKALPKVTKIIVSTNIADACVMSNAVRFVIDTCKIRTKVLMAGNTTPKNSLQLASRANLQHRREIAGCFQNGYYFCLISEADLKELPEFPTLRAFHKSLHEIMLITKLLRIDSCEQILSEIFETPVTHAKDMLQDMQCLNSNSEITPLGQTLARLPIDPKLGKMMLLGMIFGVGDAMATLTVHHLMYVQTLTREKIQQNYLSKYRFSSHMNVLDALQNISDSQNCGSSDKEKLLMNEMFTKAARVMNEAKKLKGILLEAGFSEESLLKRTYNFLYENQDVNMMTALLLVGLSPNIAYFLRAPNVRTADNGNARVYQWLLRCGNSPEELDFYSPFFVFSESIKLNFTEKCEQLTMVTPIHLLLFGCKIERTNKLIRLDNWINLEMDPNAAAVIVALRSVLDELVTKVSQCPESLTKMTPVHQRVIGIIRKLCAIKAGCYGFEMTDNSNCGLQRSVELETKETLKRNFLLVNSAQYSDVGLLPNKILKEESSTA